MPAQPGLNPIIAFIFLRLAGFMVYKRCTDEQGCDGRAWQCLRDLVAMNSFKIGVRSRCPIPGVLSQHLLLAHTVVELLGEQQDPWCWMPHGVVFFFLHKSFPRFCLGPLATHTEFHFTADFYFKVKSRQNLHVGS